MTIIPRIEEDALHIVFTNRYVVYKISKTGLSNSLVANATGKEYIPDTPRTFAHYRDVASPPNHLSRSVVFVRTSDNEGDLLIGFNTDIQMRLACKAYPTHILFELVEILDITTGDPATSILATGFAQLRLLGDASNRMSGAVHKDDFVISELALNPETFINPATDRNNAGRHLVSALNDAGASLLGAKVALLACPRDEWLVAVRELETLHGLLSPAIEGIWAKQHPDVKTSYLFVDLTVGNADEMIDYARQGGFKYFLIYSNTWAKTTGHYKINNTKNLDNTKNFPGGLTGSDSLRSVADKVHARGFKFGLHCLSYGIQKQDPYVSPSPHPQIFKQNPLPLAVDIGPTTLFIPVSLPADTYLRDEMIKAYEDYFRDGEKDILIEGEIILCERFETTPTPGFKVQKRGRGAYQTAKVHHPAGMLVFHLPEFYGKYLPQPDSDLFRAIGKRIAKVYNTVQADFAYLDGHEGMASVTSPNWFGRTMATEGIVPRMRGNLLIQTSGTKENYEWHAMARGVSDDHAFIGVKPYLDNHKIASYWDNYQKGFLQQELGWIGLRARVAGVGMTDSYASTTLDEIEYIMNRALGFGLPIGLETRQADLRENHLTDKILKLINTYETLRIGGYFPDSILDMLQQPGKEFHLVKNRAGRYGFQERVYTTHIISEARERWEFDNPFAEQPLRLRITALPACADYDDNQNLNLASVADKDSFEVTKGEQSHISFDPLQDSGGKLRVVVKNHSDSEYGWLKITRPLFPDDLRQRVLSDHKAIGLEVMGDGKGEVVSIQLSSDASEGVLNRQYQFVVDFNGLRYKELLLPTTTELYNYPYESGSLARTLKRSFRMFNYGNVSQLTIYIKNIPPRDPRALEQVVTLDFGPIKALKQQALPLRNPSLRVGRQTVTFQTTLQPRILASSGGKQSVFEPWEYLSLDGEKYHKYDGNHKPLSTGKPRGRIPIIQSGMNSAHYRSILAGGRYSNKALVEILMGSDPVFPD